MKASTLQQAKYKKVFVILLNWNNWGETRECLRSLEEVDYPSFEVIVADNNSSTSEVEKIRNFHTAHYVSHTLYNKDNLGFAGGNNAGIKYALERGADYVMLLNNDTAVAPDFLTKLVRAAESDKSAGILGSKIYRHGTDEVVFEGGDVNMWLTKAQHTRFAGEAKQGEQHTTYYPVDYVTGAAMLVKREVVEKIGPMREEYFLYYEDADWCLRARRAGYKCVVVPESHIWHKVSATNKEGSSPYIYYHTRNALMLARFNGNIIQKTAAYLLGFWILAKQLPKFAIPGKKMWARPMTRGVIDFYINRYGKYAHRD